MSRSRSRHSRAVPLTDAAAARLARGLRAIAATSYRAFDRRSDRLALTVRPRDRGPDTLPGGFVPLDSWRLVALGYRLADDGRGGLRRRAPLAVYRPRVDLPGTGRIGFECVVAYDAAARGKGHGRVNQLDARRAPDAARAAVLLHQAVEDARPEDLGTGPALPRLYWAFRPERPPAFEPSFGPGEWTAAEVRIGAFRAWPAEMLVRPPGAAAAARSIPSTASPDPWMAGDVRDAATAGADEGPAAAGSDGAGQPRSRWAQEPAAICASLGHLRGRSVPQPGLRGPAASRRADPRRRRAPRSGSSRWAVIRRAARETPPPPSSPSRARVERTRHPPRPPRPACWPRSARPAARNGGGCSDVRRGGRPCNSWRVWS